MKKFFNLSNPFWRMMALLSDMMVLTLVWFFFSLPVVTLVPATVALFATGVHLNNDSGRGVIREFIAAFFDMFKSTFFPGLGILALLIIIVVDIIYYHSIEAAAATFWMFFFIFLGILFASFLLYILPLKSMFPWSWKTIMLKGFMMAMQNLKWTLFLLTVNGAILFVTFYAAPYLSLFTIGGLAWLDTKVIMMLLEKESVING